MDKTFLFILISFFVICACFISWAAVGGPKRSIYCKWLVLGYTVLTWLCIIALIILALLV